MCVINWCILYIVCITRYINGKISNLKLEYRAGTKRKLTRSRLLVHTIYATHNNSHPKKINDTSLYNIGLVSLIYLGWELLCVAYIVCTRNLDLVSFLFVPALYSTMKLEIFPFTCLLTFCGQQYDS